MAEDDHPAAGDITALYERHADAYDHARARSLFERAWLDRFTSRLSAGASVLDLGCGMGEPIAAHLLRSGFAVTGVDAAPSLVSRAQARLPAGLWLNADMRRLSLGRTFDGIVAWDSFFHLTRADQRAMLPVIASHAHGGTALLLTTGPRDGEAIGTFEGDALYHASLAPEAYRALFAAHGFTVEDHTSEDPDCGGHTVWLAVRKP